jgi:TP901 family phage tail tape measure protein
MTGDVKDFEAALAASNARVIAFGASTAVLGGVIRSFKELANVTIDVEKNLADINRVFGLTTGQLQKFSTDLFSVGKQTASTFDDASKAALEFSRQGLKAEEVLIRTKDALTLARVAGISTANSVDALTSTINGFAATGVTTTQILNKLVAVEQDFAVGAGDLAEALSRTGQAAQEAGVSLDQLNALVTAAQQSTARGGAVIGNALKTIFTRLQRTETLDQLEAFNIAVRDVQGNTLPAVTVLQNFAGAYKNLGDAQRAQLSEQVAGVYQVNILKAIVGDLNKSQGVYAGALQRGASATNEAEVATAKLNRTLDALLKQTATSTQQLANNIGKVTFEPLARYGTEQLKSLVESMNEILEGEGVGSTFANGLLKGIRNVIAGPGAIAAFFTLFKLIQNSFTYLAQALPQIAGITTETQNRKNIEQSILQIMAQQGTVAQALDGLTGNQAAQAQLLLQTARAQTAEYQKQAALAKELSVLLSGQGVKVAGSRGLQVTRAGGYIPAATRMAETVGAQAGGYAPGKVVKSPVGGVMNTAEDVKYVPGFAQPFINPPAGSKAGRAHRQNAISRTGVDPYTAGGFIPNFANTKYFNKNKNKDTLTLSATKKKPFIIPNNQELATVADVNKDSVYGLKYKIQLAGSYSRFSESFDKKMETTKQAENLLKFSSLTDSEKTIFIEDYQRYKENNNEDFEVKPFTANKKQYINFSKQLQGVKSDTLGNRYESYLEKKLNLEKNPNQTSISDLDFVDAEAKIGDFSSANLLSKAIRDHAVKKGIKKPYYKDNKKSDKIDLDNRLLTLYTTTASQGFIPNFAIPMEAGRIPWFKKYSTLLKNTSGDKDVFRQKDFPTFGNGSDHFYATNGNNDMVGSLYEKFILSAMNIARNSSVFKTTKELGLKEFPVTDLGNTAAFDLGEDMGPEGLIGIQAKAGSKNNQTSGGGVNKTLTSNIERFGAQNPSRIKDLKKAVLIYNDPRYHDPTGKNPAGFLSPFEQTISGIVKSNYSSVDEALKPKLTKVTDDLLSYYEKNKNTKNAKSLFDGFIPNFNMGNRMRENMLKNNLRPILFDLANKTYGYSGQDGKEYLYHKDIYNNKLKTKGANINDYDFSELHNLVRGFIYPTGQITWDYSGTQQKALEDANVKAKVLAILSTATITSSPSDKEFKKITSNEADLKQRSIKPLNIPPSQQFRNRFPDDEPNPESFSKGFIPNFAKSVTPTEEQLTRFGITKGEYEKLSRRDKKDVHDSIKNARKTYTQRREEGERLRGLDPTQIKINEIKKKAGNRFIYKYILDDEGQIHYDKKDRLHHHEIAHRDRVEKYIRGYFATPPPEVLDSLSGLASSPSDKEFKKITSNKADLKQRLIKIFSKPLTYGASTLTRSILNAQNPGPDPESFSNGFIPNFAPKPFNFRFSSLGEKTAQISPKLRDWLADKYFDPEMASAGTLERLASLNRDSGAFFSSLENPNAVAGIPVRGQQGFISRQNRGARAGAFLNALRARLPDFVPGSLPNLASGFIPNFGLSEGFIPNFAYKQAVMGLEESMSGEKAVFDNKPFPHIRNKSQPTFSSAISDHGGLENALSDSMRGQKNAGLMNRGFIPNFNPRIRKRLAKNKKSQQSSTAPASAAPAPVAPASAAPTATATPVLSNEDIDSAFSNFITNIQNADEQMSLLESMLGGRTKLIDAELGKFKNTLIAGGVSGQKLDAVMNKASKEINSQQSKFSKNLSSASTAIAIAGPMLAGFAEQAVFGNRKRTEMTSGERQSQSILSTGLSSISTGAGIGASFGLPGVLIGGVAGGLVALTSALNAATLTAEELGQLNEEQTQKAQANISAASSYVEAQKSFTDMVAKGASSTEIETATKNLANNFSQIKDTKLQEMFLSAGGDVSIMTKQLQDYTNQVTKESAKQTGLYGANLKPEERASALSIGLGKERAKDFITSARKSLEDAQKASDLVDKEADIGATKGNNAFTKFLYSLGDSERRLAKKLSFQKFAEDQTPASEPDRESKVKSLVQNLLDGNFEEVLKALAKNLSVSDLSNVFANFNKIATESYSAIFERIANNLQKQNFDLEKRFITATGENKIQNTILEFSTGLTGFIDSFLSDTLDEFSKFQMAPQIATRKYTEGLNRIQLNNNRFQIDQEKSKNDFLEKNASKLMDTFKSNILQSQQNAEYFEKTMLPKIQGGDYSFDLSSVLETLNNQNLEQAKKTIEESGIKNPGAENLTSAEGRKNVLKTLTDKANASADGSVADSEKIAKAIRAVNSLSKSADFLENTNAKKAVGYAIELATEEKIKFNNNQKYLEEENRIKSAFEAARLKAETELAVKKAEVDKGILLRLRAMREFVDELQVKSAISATRGNAQAQLTEAQVQDPFRMLGKGVRSNTEETIGLENRAIRERRKVEDASLNDQIRQAAIEIVTREANTTALQGLTDAVFNLTSSILKEQMGGSYEEMKQDPYIRMNRQELSAAADAAAAESSIIQQELQKQYDMQYSGREENNRPPAPDFFDTNNNPQKQLAQINKTRSYSPEQTSAFKAYEQLQQQRPSSLKGYDYSQYKTDLLQVDPNNKLDKKQISDITSNFKSRATQLGVSENETTQLTQDEQTLSLYQQLETIRNKALESKTKESEKIAEDARALQNRLIKEKDILVIQRDIGDQIKKNTDEYKRMQSTFSGNFVIGVRSLTTQSEELINNLGRDLPKMFADGLVDGIKAAIRESDNLGEALMGIAGKFLDEISTAMMKSAMYGLLGSVGMSIPGFGGMPGFGQGQAPKGGKQKGGYIRAQSGMYISGSGSGDKYPALLENGEYVLNRNAVMAMGGPADIDKLNFSMAPRFASGGSFLTEFADLKSMEEGMTTAGLENSNLYGELRDTERQKQEEKRQKRRKRKEMIAGVVGSLAAMAVSLGISKGISSLPKSSAQLETNASLLGSPEQMSIRNGRAFMPTRRQTGGLIGSRLSDTIPAYAEGGLYNNSIVKKYGIGLQNGGMGSSVNNSNVVNNSNAANSFNFNTNVNRDGTIQVGSDSTSYKQQDVELSENLNNKIYGAVLGVIKDQQRFGGSLAGTRRAT